MAPNKRNFPNGFMIFTHEWKNKYGRHLSLKDATDAAGKHWATMDIEARKPYNQKAKERKNRSHADEKYTCNGVPLDVVEKEQKELELKERRIKRHIEQSVKQSIKRAELEHQKYYFIMINHFAKTLNSGAYLPAELAVCEFSLELGVTRVYHSLINPNVNIYGYHFDAQHYSDTTHNLPLPPNALGDKNLSAVYNAVLEFLRQTEDSTTIQYPPVYTLRECIPIVESCFDFLQADIGASNVKLDVYPIQYLFYTLKLATCEQGEISQVPANCYISDAYFEKDPFEYQSGIACQFHEERDRTKYCAQSLITRWGYMFADYMCKDIAVKIIPGRHVPKNTRLDAIITLAADSSCADNESLVSLRTNTTFDIKPLSDAKYYHENDSKTPTSQSIKSYNKFKNADENEFPSLSSSSRNNQKSSHKAMHKPSYKHYESYKDAAAADPNKNMSYGDDGPSTSSRTHVKKCSSKSSHSHLRDERFEDSDEDDNDNNDWQYVGKSNPWSSRSHQKPREPDDAHYSVSADLDDTYSVSSFGRGRSLSNFLNNSKCSGAGRGHLMRP